MGELRARYGVGHASLRTALESLRADRVLEHHGRGFRIPPLTAHAPYTTVVFVGKTRAMDIMTDLAPRSQQLWRALEDRCSHGGVRLVVRSVEDMLERPSPGGHLERPGVLAGYLVRNLDLPARHATRLLSTLASSRRPVALADELGEAEDFARKVPSRRLQVFSLAHSAGAGYELGRHLLSLGHRRLAFFSPYHAADWSSNRLIGLRTAGEQAGPGIDVRAFVGTELADDFALRDFARTSDAFVKLCNALRTFRRRANPESDEPDDAFVRDPAFGYVLRHVMAYVMSPLFRQALADRSITVWVGANDAVALAAAGFLTRERAGTDGRPVNDISVAGFDNTFGAIAADLTSYDFNVGALADAMLRHVLNPGRAIGRKTREPVEVSGLVVCRGSVARVSGSADAR
ncbi:MAG: hypothetical protein GF331_21995 [Chitinivibrionales bacterium]|nr:hypothetical protein [Chitinivibrionales bacterium]